MTATGSPKSKGKQISQYEKFRIQRLNERKDDDNLSAHFSNPLSNMTDRQQDLLIHNKLFLGRNTTGNHKQNPTQKQPSQTQKQLQNKLFQKQKQHNELVTKYEQLMKKYEESLKQTEYYKKKYEQKILKDKETKRKLQGWIKSAKSDLLQSS